MKVEEAIRQINAQPTRYFKPAKKSGYICPLCDSGSGKNGTGITQHPQTHKFKCFACGFSGDIIDYIIEENHINDWKEGLQRACDIYNIDYKSLEFNGHSGSNTQHTHYTEHTHNTQPKQDKQHTEETTAINELIKADIEEASLNIDKSDYITKKRGISLETARRFKIGYIENWTHPKARGKAKPTPRLILPTGDYSYTARNLNEDIDKKDRYQHAGETRIFNEVALYDTSKPCFICEGEIDALTVLECGFNAVALGSASNCNLLKRTLENAPALSSYIIYFDSDDTGKRDSEAVYNTLKGLGANVANITGKEESYHDVNDFFIAFKESLVAFLGEAIKELDRDKEKAKLEYINTNNALAYLGNFIDGIKNSVNTPYTPTGFKDLDNILDGGLYEGLYILGAISSLGKTTFILQIADQIAKSGQDVLFFSLEQARAELMAKSISRETALYCKENGLNTSNAKSVRGVTVASRYANYSETEKRVISTAINRYKDTAKNLYVYEGIGDISVKQMRETIEKHIEVTGNKPVVFIDYLQILAPYDDKSRTDKQVTDLNISALKRLSRNLKLSIIGISSFNRDNYNTSVNMSSFKESGAIEYSSDVLIGLQFKGIDDIKQSDSNKKEANEFVEKAKGKNPREVELKLLKNRNGATDKRGLFRYYPMFNLYEEVSEEEQDIEEAYKDYRQAKGRY